MSNEKFTPDMEALKAELGRTPPPPPKSKPEDFAPKKLHASMAEAELAQTIKFAIRDNEGWSLLGADQREALDLIATEISRICAGHHGQWIDLAKWASRGALRGD